ncbi:hypothetical protein [Nocardioides conyzicola]|uniref:Uncharacterized protein n=1 Tax=Nocardioides conyzicola TaxID=1651781 RepID=A0ABP8WQ89_9ACTN
MRHALAARLSAATLVVAAVLLPSAAHADSRVTVANPAGQAKVDPTYATTLTVSGSGFQSIKGGHGGIYVFFGTVSPGWQPSKGGATGKDYYYVPDSESKDNQGFQRFVAFPGSDTASSANGGTMSASGGWSTRIVVPGATFQTYDRAGDVHTVDCRKVTCGVITVGAHGVANAHNETFTPVTVGSLGAAATSTPSAAPTAVATGPAATADPSAPAGPGTGSGPRPAGAAALEVDRASAVAGNVLAFSATGLPAGTQVSAVFDDGAAGAGPFLAGADGSLAGVITLPADTGAGTHELRLYGVAKPPSVSFAVQPAETTAEVTTPAAAEDDDTRAAWLFAGAAALVLLVAVARLGLRGWKGRRRAA